VVQPLTAGDNVVANISTVSGGLNASPGEIIRLAADTEMNWQVYIIFCTDNSLYTGITTDVERRLAQHGTARGAKYFRGRKPRRLVYLEGGHTRSSASQREAAIKKLLRAEKEQLIASSNNELGEYRLP